MAYRITAPTGIEKNGEFYSSQLEDRLACGFDPVVLMNTIKNPWTMGALHNYLRNVSQIERYGRKIRVDFVANLLGHRIQEGESWTFEKHDVLSKLEAVAKFKELVKGSYGVDIGSFEIRPGSIRPLNEFYGVNCDFNCEEYEEFFNRNLENVVAIAEKAREYGIKVTTQNYHRNSFNSLKQSNPDLKKLEPRWNGTVSHELNQTGLILSSAKELNVFFRQARNIGLNLDLEHVAQAAEYGFVYYLDKPFTSQVKRFKDIHERSESKIYTGIYRLGGLNDGELVFDYSDLSLNELMFLDKFGFIVRKGQPLVFNQQATFRSELEGLNKDIDVSSIEAGRQVSMFYIDFPSEFKLDGIRKVGSHIPYYLPKYVEDVDRRQKLIRQSDNMLLYALSYIRENFGLEELSTAYQVGDEKGTVYEGGVWREDANIAKAELEVLLMNTFWANKIILPDKNRKGKHDWGDIVPIYFD